MRGSNRILVLLLIIALVLGFMVWQSGGSIWGVLAYDCRLTGESLGRPWQWVRGACYIQQVDGNWARVDTNSNVPNP